MSSNNQSSTPVIKLPNPVPALRRDLREAAKLKNLTTAKSTKSENLTTAKSTKSENLTTAKSTKIEKFTATKSSKSTRFTKHNSANATPQNNRVTAQEKSVIELVESMIINHPTQQAQEVRRLENKVYANLSARNKRFLKDLWNLSQGFYLELSLPRWVALHRILSLPE